MPMWKIYAPEGAYTKEQKKAFSDSITQIYVDFADLPRFYVVVVFHEQPLDTIWVGGEPANDFIRITIDHIARKMPNLPDFQEMTMAAFEEALAPHVKDRGFRWEFHVDETPIELWRVNGLKPPPAESEAEKLWALHNAPLPYESVETVARA
ncbi:tautomerase family protein [Rhodococcus erythropolis]